MSEQWARMRARRELGHRWHRVGTGPLIVVPSCATRTQIHPHAPPPAGIGQGKTGPDFFLGQRAPVSASPRPLDPHRREGSPGPPGYLVVGQFAQQPLLILAPPFTMIIRPDVLCEDCPLR